MTYGGGTLPDPRTNPTHCKEVQDTELVLEVVAAAEEHQDADIPHVGEVEVAAEEVRIPTIRSYGGMDNKDGDAEEHGDDVRDTAAAVAADDEVDIEKEVDVAEGAHAAWLDRSVHASL